MSTTEGGAYITTGGETYMSSLTTTISLSNLDKSPGQCPFAQGWLIQQHAVGGGRVRGKIRPSTGYLQSYRPGSAGVDA